MKFNQLRDFVAVADTGSLRGAARALGLSQPAISRSVQELEHSLGTQLFVRGARGVTLTPIGETFLTRAHAILEQVQRSREEVSQLQGGVEGELVVGLSIAAHLGLLGEALRPFRKRYPNVRLSIIEGFLPTLEAELLRGTVDLFVGPVLGGTPMGDLVARTLFENERVVMARAGHPLANARALAELRDASWLTTSITHNAEDELSAVFAEHGLPAPRLFCRSQSALSTLTVLTSSDALAMVPRQWVDSPLMSHLVQPLALKERFAAPPITLVHRAGLGLTPAGEFFVATLERVANSRQMQAPASTEPNR